MGDELIERLRSFANYHEDLWPAQGMGIAQVAFRDAITTIETLQARIAELEAELQVREDLINTILATTTDTYARIAELNDNTQPKKRGNLEKT